MQTSFSSPAKVSADLQKLTDSFLEKTKLNESRGESVNATAGSFTSPIKTFSPEKEAALRAQLQSRGTIRIKPVIPKSPNESRFLNFEDPDRKKKEQAFLTQKIFFFF